VRLEPLYRTTFATPESWSVQLSGSALDGGSEAQSFLIAEGRTSGQVSARLRAANYPRRRVDGVLLPDFRGVLEVDDGAVVMISWHGITALPVDGMRRLTGTLTHLSDDPRYARLNDVVCTCAGEVRSRPGGGYEVVLDVAELVWEPLPAGAEPEPARP
jgi:hypothetical protein